MLASDAPRVSQDRAGSRSLRGRQVAAIASSSPRSRASASAGGVGGPGAAGSVRCGTATPPRSATGGRAAKPGSAGFCSGGLREIDSRRAVERPGSEGQLLGAARARRQRPRGAARPRRGGARAHRPGPRVTFSRSCHDGRRGSSRSPFLCWLPTSASVTRSCWCWTTFTSITAKTSRSILAFLAEQVPSGSQLVLVTRGDRGLRLGRLRASGDLVEVGAALLALDTEETRAVAALGGLELSEEAAEALRERTEGWAAAVALATTLVARPRRCRHEGCRSDRHSAADRRLPPGRGAGAPAGQSQDVPARYVDPRPDDAAPVRCGARHGRRGRFARGPRALECVRRPARRSRRVVPLPPPVQ